MDSVYLKKDFCCGCGACRLVCPKQCIVMAHDAEGFPFPVIDSSECIDCGICRKFCDFQEPAAEEQTDVPAVFALKHKQGDVLKNSTSGGAFTAFSDFVLDKNGVVFGVLHDEALKVKTAFAETKAGRDQFRGSKYVQSDLGDSFLDVRRFLREGRFVLFSGTPCQAASLKRFLQGENTEKLLLVDLLCYGVSSPLLFAQYVAFLEEKNHDKIVEYYHRLKVNYSLQYKNFGWNGLTEGQKYSNGSLDYQSFESQMHQALYEFSLSRSCPNCKYARMHHVSDITIGDFWGIESLLPDFDHNEGASLMLVHSEKGMDYFDAVKDSVNFEATQSGYLQPIMTSPTPVNPRREQFLADWHQYGFQYIIRHYADDTVPKRVGWKIKAPFRYVPALIKVQDMLENILHK
ncbi:MAG: Coenzyme F420 hydrogenase/dehydrogenase, beta subunit C-terminal domain [Clostridiales Family XIII bacterium]|jgi:coenzyme F420-reducing hydrogenase beta subunit|nr:Coenzyme F420 hydrogenase/dehydrogenase, beta subunit C-terminal domain [Clostridiales Family XIII bacterium]